MFSCSTSSDFLQKCLVSSLRMDLVCPEAIKAAFNNLKGKWLFRDLGPVDADNLYPWWVLCVLGMGQICLKRSETSGRSVSFCGYPLLGVGERNVNPPFVGPLRKTRVRPRWPWLKIPYPQCPNPHYSRQKWVGHVPQNGIQNGFDNHCQMFDVFDFPGGLFFFFWLGDVSEFSRAMHRSRCSDPRSRFGARIWEVGVLFSEFLGTVWEDQGKRLVPAYSNLSGGPRKSEKEWTFPGPMYLGKELWAGASMAEAKPCSFWTWHFWEGNFGRKQVQRDLVKPIPDRSQNPTATSWQQFGLPRLAESAFRVRSGEAASRQAKSNRRRRAPGFLLVEGSWKPFSWSGVKC